MELAWEPASRVRARIAAAVVPPDGAPVTVGSITLMSHQRDAAWVVRQAIARWGGALLADPVGTGKTWVALAVAQDYSDVVVVAPAALRSRWRDALATAGRLAAFHSFESLPRAVVDQHPPAALVIVDEAHHARNASTQRFDTLARLTWGRPVLLLTATPVHNRASDLHTLCSLFLGHAAERLPADTLAQLVCRRIDVAPAGMPSVDAPTWLPIDDDPAMLALLRDLPPPVPPSDGGSAGALGTLALLRQWASSESALLAALERRLTIGVAMELRLAQGGTLTRAELRRWIVEAGTVQLGLPLVDDGLSADLSTTIEQVRAHLHGLRNAREHLLRRAPLDRQRIAHVRRVIAEAPSARCVCFSHSVDTARAIYRALAPGVRTALLAGAETRIASGAVARDEVVRQFAPGAHSATAPAMRIDVLVATDVMSEGVDLHDAGVLVHLDLPWTMARLEQRLGRLRRLGATHEHLRQVAFEPPGGAGRMLRLLDRLTRKAGIASRLVGDDPLALALPHHRRNVASSPAEGASRLRALFEPWLGERSCEGQQSCGGITRAAVVGSIIGDGACLALVDCGDGARIILRSMGEVIQDAQRIGNAVASCLTNAPDIAPGESQRRTLQLNVRAILSWCRRRAEHLDLLGPGAASVQRRVVRRLATLREQRGRHARRDIAERLARTAAVVLRSRGAGVERWLEAWLFAHATQDITTNTLRELHAALDPRAPPLHAARQPHVMAALLIVPAHARCACAGTRDSPTA